MARELLKIKKFLVPVDFLKNKKNFLCQWVQALTKIKKISCGPSGPDLLGRRPYPGASSQAADRPTADRPPTADRRAIGKLGHALDFRTIGNLGNAIDFVNIGILGNCSDIAKIANDFG